MSNGTQLKGGDKVRVRDTQTPVMFVIRTYTPAKTNVLMVECEWLSANQEHMEATWAATTLEAAPPASSGKK